ncbi:putative ankyrin repeat protein FPV162 [Colletotrichum siamense]|nr:putative ankyrin repeat protein FPV162 [Colletotrichum siamense]KAF4877935.1 putative ankyrin repeat protein FPV162 [Colletotrichum siamense]
MAPSRCTFASDAAPTRHASCDDPTIPIADKMSSMRLSSAPVSTGDKRPAKTQPKRTHAGFCDLPQELVTEIVDQIFEGYGEDWMDGYDKEETQDMVYGDRFHRFDVWRDLVNLAATCKTLYQYMTADIYEMDSEYNYSSALLLSAKKGNVDGMMRSLENGAEIDQTDRTEWEVTCDPEYNEYETTVRRSLHYDMTSLHWASHYCHLDAMRFLLERGADADYRMEAYQAGQYNLFNSSVSSVISIFRRHLECMPWFWDDGIPMFLDRGANPLFFALISYSMDLDPQQEVARDASRNEAVQMLLDAGCSFDTHRKLGIHALHQACGLRNEHVARICLVDSAADANVRDILGNTPMHYFALDGSVEYDEPQKLINLLMQHGADINAPNAAGYTPLHYVMSFWLEGEHLDEEVDHLVALLKAGAYLLPAFAPRLRDRLRGSGNYEDKDIERWISEAEGRATTGAFSKGRLPSIEDLRRAEERVVYRTFYHCSNPPQNASVPDTDIEKLTIREWREYWEQRYWNYLLY